jgi:hypothetical protein
VVFGCLQAPLAQNFLLSFSIDGLYQHMSPVEYCTILKYHIMILLFSIDGVCHVCRKACLDNFGEHAIHCRELLGFKYRHDFIQDAFFDFLGMQNIYQKRDACGLFDRPTGECESFAKSYSKSYE